MKRLVLLLMLALAGCGVFKAKKKTPSVGERLSVLTLSVKTEPDPALKDVEVTTPLPVANADWPQPGGSAAKDLGNVTLDATPREVWTARIAGSSSTRRLSSTPVVAGGKVFAIDTMGDVTAFALDDGRELWRTRLRRKGMHQSEAFGGGVSADGGHVYAETGFGVIEALDANSGNSLWRRELAVPLRGAPAVDGDRIYALSIDNQLFVLNATNGQSVWDAAATVEQAGLLGAATPAVAQGTVVAGYSSGELVGYLAANGRVVWQDQLSRTGRSTAIAALADIDASPVIDRDRVFAIGHGGRLVALELGTGTRVWERNFAGVSLPWVAGDWVYATTIQGELVCLSRADGRVRWVTQLPSFRNAKKKKGEIRWYGPVMASGRLWVTGTNGRVGWVDPKTGKLGPTIGLKGPFYLPPVIANATLIVLNDDGRITALK
ncbi:MAG: PQQ-binding-like beta-propeller repeat protein [Sphingomonadaceae bacterium]|nr:PQQ-binding-like beta-propeller repeat protein [Sphingomonadaceae bacterium]